MSSFPIFSMPKRRDLDRPALAGNVIQSLPYGTLFQSIPLWYPEDPCNFNPPALETSVISGMGKACH